MNVDLDALSKWIGVAAAVVGLVAALAKLKPDKVFKGLLVAAVLAGGAWLVIGTGGLNGLLALARSSAVGPAAPTALNVPGAAVAPPGAPGFPPPPDANPSIVILGTNSARLPPKVPSAGPPTAVSANAFRPLPPLLSSLPPSPSK